MRTQELILDRARMEGRPWEPFREVPGVRHKPLWRDPRGSGSAGLLSLEGGASIPAHVHRYAVHHVWVAEGRCTVDGVELGPGCYSFVPADAVHGIERAGSGGCTVFYVLVPAEMD